ncbi:MAG: peptidylprolyl isomerase [Gammaproteobacteria bacterium]|nr:peptidylprolyl isomerase [Gammaproteobacteria bacterium]
MSSETDDNKQSLDTVEKNSNVSIYFSLTLADKTVVDGTNTDEPMTFSLGQGIMIPALEDVLLGMKVGESREVRLPPRETFGFPEESNHHWIEKEKFEAILEDEDELIPGMMVEFNTPAGDRLPGIVMELGDDKILMDFNHPLAGHELNFSVEILKINL